MRPICWAILALSGVLCMAQGADTTKTPAKFYKLDFVIKDLEGGKVITARNYSMIVQSNEGSFLRSGSRVAVGGGAVSNLVDVGTDIDCNVGAESEAGIAFSLKVAVSSILSETDPHSVIRQNKWQSSVIIPLKKPTVVYSSDDNTTKRVLQMEVTATPRI